MEEADEEEEREWDEEWQWVLVSQALDCFDQEEQMENTGPKSERDRLSNFIHTLYVEGKWECNETKA